MACVCVCVCVCVCAGLGMVLGMGYEYHCPVTRYCRGMKASKMVKTLDLEVRRSWIQILGPGNLGQVRLLSKPWFPFFKSDFTYLFWAVLHLCC